jgi:hypothetical protein
MGATAQRANDPLQARSALSLRILTDQAEGWQQQNAPGRPPPPCAMRGGSRLLGRLKGGLALHAARCWAPLAHSRGRAPHRRSLHIISAPSTWASALIRGLAHRLSDAQRHRAAPVLLHCCQDAALTYEAGPRARKLPAAPAAPRLPERSIFCGLRQQAVGAVPPVSQRTRMCDRMEGERQCKPTNCACRGVTVQLCAPGTCSSASCEHNLRGGFPRSYNL